MSKMSQLNAELTEQAYELGFESLDEALANGYEVDYEEKQLVNPYVLLNKAHEEAHEEWLKEREEVVFELERLITAYAGAEAIVKPVRRAISFIMEEKI